MIPIPLNGTLNEEFVFNVSSTEAKNRKNNINHIPHNPYSHGYSYPAKEQQQRDCQINVIYKKANLHIYFWI